MSEMIQATIEGRKHSIPGIWVAGFCQANRCDTQAAILYWDWQAQLEASESA